MVRYGKYIFITGGRYGYSGESDEIVCMIAGKWRCTSLARARIQPWCFFNLRSRTFAQSLHRTAVKSLLIHNLTVVDVFVNAGGLELSIVDRQPEDTRDWLSCQLDPHNSACPADMPIGRLVQDMLINNLDSSAYLATTLHIHGTVRLAPLVMSSAVQLMGVGNGRSIMASLILDGIRKDLLSASDHDSAIAQAFNSSDIEQPWNNLCLTVEPGVQAGVGPLDMTEMDAIAYTRGANQLTVNEQRRMQCLLSLQTTHQLTGALGKAAATLSLHNGSHHIRSGSYHSLRRAFTLPYLAAADNPLASAAALNRSQLLAAVRSTSLSKSDVVGHSAQRCMADRARRVGNGTVLPTEVTAAHCDIQLAQVLCNAPQCIAVNISAALTYAQL